MELVFENYNNFKSVNEVKAIEYTSDVETDYNTRYNAERDDSLKGSDKISDQIDAAMKVYNGVTFKNGDATYILSVDKKAKDETKIIFVKAKKGSQTGEMYMSPANVPFMLG